MVSSTDIFIAAMHLPGKTLPFCLFLPSFKSDIKLHATDAYETKQFIVIGLLSPRNTTYPASAWEQIDDKV